MLPKVPEVETGAVRGVDRVLDARGLTCPLPVLKARKILLQMPPEAVLRVLATDPRTGREFGLFCEDQGFRLISAIQSSAGDWEVSLCRI